MFSLINDESRLKCKNISEKQFNKAYKSKGFEVTDYNETHILYTLGEEQIMVKRTVRLKNANKNGKV